ncbi:MAG: hypothetical protein ABI591_12720 [Kofleriaceae bacterium]
MAILCCLLGWCSQARADVIYGELLGKAGQYGVGYEHPITERLSLGGAGSIAILRGQQIYTATPYVHADLITRGANGMFLELGAVIAHSRIPSPVTNWSGTSETGGGGFLSLGYQRTEHWLVMRAALSVVVGEGGAAPAVGFAFGVKP